MSAQGGKTIMGSIDGKNYQNAAMQYRGFGDDICSSVASFAASHDDAFSGIVCKKEGSTYYVLVQGSQSTSINPESIWPDLTSKIRLSEKFNPD